MLWTRQNSRKLNKEQYETLSQNIEKLQQKDSRFLAGAYCTFVYGDRELVMRAGTAIRELLETYPMQQMISLSERFRQTTSLDWLIDWEKQDLQFIRKQFAEEMDYFYALILGTFHPNGYFRETCVLELADYPGSLPYLILRMNDWVGTIRETVFELILGKIGACPVEEVLLSMQAFEKVEKSQRCGDESLCAVEEKLSERIRADLPGIPLYRISQYEFHTRKNIYRLLFSQRFLTLEAANDLLYREKHSFCQSIILSGIL